MCIWINDIEVYTIEIITINLRMTFDGGRYNVRCDIWVKYEKQVFAFFFLTKACKLTKKKKKKKKKKIERKIYNFCLQKLS